MLQQLLLGFAREAEGTVLRVREARAPCRRGQLLEVGFVNGAAAGVHSRGGVPGEGEKGDHCPPPGRPQTPETPRGHWPSRTSPGPVAGATEEGRLGAPSTALEAPHSLALAPAASLLAAGVPAVSSEAWHDSSQFLPETSRGK